MMAALMKWLASLAGGLLIALYEYLQHVPTDNVAWKVLVLGVLVRAAAWAVSKLPVGWA